VFEIGSTLREARVRRKLTLQQAEQDTKIRVKYLQAMENEEFEVMPGPTYVKGFLRTYAVYLDLDPKIILDEYRSRGLPDEEHEPFGGSSALRPRSHRGRNTLAFVAVLCLLVLALFYMLGLNNSRGAHKLPKPIVVTSPTPKPKPSATHTPTGTPVGGVSALTLTARGGKCWVEVRTNGATGKVLFSNIIPAGNSMTFHGATLWFRIGDPSKLRVTLNGVLQKSSTSVDPINYLVVHGKLVRKG
jgi:cytoskeleton protein RodZ